MTSATTVRGTEDEAASGLGAAGERARWFRLLEQQNALIELISRGAPLAASLDRLALTIASIVPAGRCAVLLWSGRDGRFDRISAPGAAAEVEDALDACAIAPADDPRFACALRRAPVALAARAAEERWSRFARCLDGLGIRACSAQPVLDQAGETLAVITLYAASPAGADDNRMIDALCPLARIAIEGSQRIGALEAANERFASIARGIPGVVYQRLVNPETGDIRYTYVSEGARELFGVSPQEILADPRALFACDPREFSAHFRENLVAASREMRMWDVEAPIIARDGTRKWSHTIARPQRLADGTVLWSGVILDATRTKEANIALAATSIAKAQFLANMSHELRTPLNAIIGFSDLMRKEANGPLAVAEYRDYVDDIHDSGTHLLKLINDILDISRLEAKKLDLDEEPLDVRAVVDASLRAMRERAAARGIAMSAEFPAELPHLVADERKLKQVLLNLLSNSIKFSECGATARVRVALDAGGGLHLSVADTGIGIAEHDLPKIFDPFFQADGGLDRRFEGSGLGLTLTKAIVELHGGTIELESRLGEGTVATVRFPPERIGPPG